VEVIEAQPHQPLDSEPVLTIGQVEIFAVPAAHNGNRWHPFAADQLALGYVLRRAGSTVYFAGDTGRGNDFLQIGRTFDIDLAILPIGAYSPRWPLARYHLSPEDAVAAGIALNAGLVVPSHFGTYRLSLDRVDSALPRFAGEADRRALSWALAPLLGIDSVDPDSVDPGSVEQRHE